MPAWFSDLRYALRTLRRNPGFAFTAVLTLMLGIGAATVIFSAVNAVLLRPLPYRDPDRLVSLWEQNTEKGWHKNWVSGADYLDWKNQARAFQSMGAYSDFISGMTLTGEGEPAYLRSGKVAGGLFDVLGVQAQLGRTFREGETWQTGSPGVVLSDAVWRAHFGADPAIVGRSITLDGRPYEVLGVLPRSFRFPVPGQEIWTSFNWDPADRGATWFRRAHFLRVVGRLAPGHTREQAGSELPAIAARLEREYPQTNRLTGAGVTGYHDWLVGDRRTPLLVLMGAVTLLLIMACVNVSNLLLVRAAARRREIAVRSALGAGRRRLLRLSWSETLVIAVVGGAAGFLLAYWGVAALNAARPADLLDLGPIRISWSVLAFSLGATLVCAFLFSLLPALATVRVNHRAALKEGGRSETGRGSLRMGQVLVSLQVALALLLMVGAGLLVRTVERLQSVNPGFQTAGRLAVTVSLPSASYPDDRAVVLLEGQLLERLRHLPGVENAAAVSSLPLTRLSWTSDFSVRGRPVEAVGLEVVHREVSPGYFQTLGVPLRAGRTFEGSDAPGGTPVIVINDVLARKYFAGENPLGKQIAFDRVPDEHSLWWTIIGVVGSEHQAELSLSPRAEIFTPITQDTRSTLRYIVHTAGDDPMALLPSVRRAVAALDRNLPVFDTRTLDQVRVSAMSRQRFLLLLLGAFGTAALVLAAVGVFGVASQSARRRTREVGIRIALGAPAGAVVRLIAQRGVLLAAAGMAAGLIAALAGTRLLGGVLYGVAPSDPLTLAATAVLLLSAVLVATWLPAWRASRVDPMTVLREE